MTVKGSWSRVTDHKAYQKNWERVFGRKKKQTRSHGGSAPKPPNKSQDHFK